LTGNLNQNGNGQDRKSTGEKVMKYATHEAYEFGRAETSVADAASRLISRYLQAVNAWRQRSRTRAQLAGMSSHLLRDIGLTRGEAMFEANKQFWEE
jgi:uncharacterized protein YjiS (DUF1127 family)